MKHPKPERLVVMEGIPMTVHSAGVLEGRKTDEVSLRLGSETPFLVELLREIRSARS